MQRGKTNTEKLIKEKTFCSAKISQGENIGENVMKKRSRKCPGNKYRKTVEEIICKNATNSLTKNSDMEN